MASTTAPAPGAPLGSPELRRYTCWPAGLHPTGQQRFFSLSAPLGSPEPHNVLLVGRSVLQNEVAFLGSPAEAVNGTSCRYRGPVHQRTSWLSFGVKGSGASSICGVPKDCSAPPQR
jgi:hypothetical protein